MAGLKPASLPHTSSLIRSEERNSAMKGEEREQELKLGRCGVGVLPSGWECTPTGHPHRKPITSKVVYSPS
jgi:hypothetical protein